MKNKRILVTTAEERTWPKENKNILFLVVNYMIEKYMAE